MPDPNLPVPPASQGPSSPPPSASLYECDSHGSPTVADSPHHKGPHTLRPTCRNPRLHRTKLS